MDVAGGDRADAERRGEVAERGVPAGVSAQVRPLELDVEALGAEGAREAGGGVRVACGEPVAGAAGEADEPLVQALELVEREARVQSLVRVRGGEEPAEVRVAALALDEERDVGAVRERGLGAGERPDAEGLGRVRELERAVDAVVVGERERRRSRARPPGRQAPRAARRRRETSRPSGSGARRTPSRFRAPLGTFRAPRARFSAIRSTQGGDHGGSPGGTTWRGAAKPLRGSARLPRYGSCLPPG